MLNLIKSDALKHTYEMIDIASKVEVGGRIKVYWRLWLTILLADALFSHLTSREKATVLTTAPDRESCYTTRLKNTIRFLDHGVRVIYYHEHQVCYVAGKPSIGVR